MACKPTFGSHDWEDFPSLGITYADDHGASRLSRRPPRLCFGDLPTEETNSHNTRSATTSIRTRRNSCESRDGGRLLEMSYLSDSRNGRGDEQIHYPFLVQHIPKDITDKDRDELSSLNRQKRRRTRSVGFFGCSHTIHVTNLIRE